MNWHTSHEITKHGVTQMIEVIIEEDTITLTNLTTGYRLCYDTKDLAEDCFDYQVLEKETPDD